MKILIDTSPLNSGHAGRGIGQYTRMLLESMKNYSRHQLVTNARNADMVHYPFFDLFFMTLPILRNKPTMVTIHDVIPLIYPQAYPKGLRGSLKLLWQKLSLNSCNQIITDSECSNTDIRKYLYQPAVKISTVYLAPNSEYQPASKNDVEEIKNKYGLQKPYLLYVGDINYNKNLPNLIKSYANFVDRVQLVFISSAMKRNNPAAADLWKLIDQLHIEPTIRIINNIQAEDFKTMASIYSGALWYIQPSLYEGFGLPILEAQACECPVIATHGGSLKEIVRDSGVVARPGKLHVTINQVLNMSNESRLQYVDRGKKNLERFSWEKTIEAMDLVYEKI